MNSRPDGRGSEALTCRSEVICTDLKVTSSFHTGCACPIATLVRFTWFSHFTNTHCIYFFVPYAVVYHMYF